MYTEQNESCWLGADITLKSYGQDSLEHIWFKNVFQTLAEVAHLISLQDIQNREN